MNELLISQYMDNADKVRGMVINNTTLLERIIDDYIAKYFSQNEYKRKELIELILFDKVDFSKKVRIVQQIFNKKCEVLGKEFTKEYPKFSADLREIYEQRNKFAHQLIAVPENIESNKYEIILLNYSDKEKFIPYTKDSIEKMMEMINSWINIIDKEYNSLL